MRNFGLPMTLANMRNNGARSVTAKCEACGHEADVNVDALPENVNPGRRALSPLQPPQRPAWHTARRQGVPDLRAERP